MTVTQVARNFSAVIESVATGGKEIRLLKQGRVVARLVPEPGASTADSVFGDLYRTLDEGTAEELVHSMNQLRSRKRGRLGEMKDPWGS